MGWFRSWSSTGSKTVTYTVTMTVVSGTDEAQCDVEANAFRDDLRAAGAQNVSLSKKSSTS